MNEQQSAFHFLTNCLNVTRQSDWAMGAFPEPDREGFWESVVELANRHLLTPALWVSLQHGALENRIPDDLRSYLEDLYGLSVERNAGLRLQTVEAVQALNTVGIEPVLMKGVVHLFTDTYRGQGARVMTDIDILVEPGEYDACLEVLLGLGYQSDIDPDEKYLTHRHCAPLFRPGGYGAIEVHRHALSGQCARILSPDEVWANCERLAVDHDTTAKVLKPGYRVLHTILHSELIDRYHPRGIMALRYLHEVATMGAVYGDLIEWKQLEQLMRCEGAAPVLRHFLYICHKLFGLPQPKQIRFGMGCVLHFAQCRAQLRYAWLDRLMNRTDRWLSRHSIIRRYGYRDSPIWMLVGRVRVLVYHLRRYGTRLLTGRTSAG